MTIQELYNSLIESVYLAVGYFSNPSKRIYLGYWASSIVLAVFVFLKTKDKNTFLKNTLGKHIWFSASAFTDYGLLIFNSFIKVVFIAPFAILGLRLSFETSEWLGMHFGLVTMPLNQFWTIFLYTLIITIVNDFVVFITHYLMHIVPFLWEFHKTHHSATVLNPITQYRIHPVELIINNAGAMLSFGLVTGVFDYLSHYHIHPFTFLGANIFSAIFLFWGANLRHSHVKLTYFNWLEYLLISPFQHQIHHSNDSKHFNKNMGSKLALWDWIFGTLIRSKEVEELEVGLGEEDKDYTTFGKNLFMPFLKIFSFLKKK